MVGFIIGVFFGVAFCGSLLAYFTYRTNEELRSTLGDELEGEWLKDQYNDRKNS